MLGIQIECTPTKTYHRFLNCGKSQLKYFNMFLILYLLCKVALNSLSSFGCQNEELGSIYPKIGRICQRFSGVIDRKSSVFRQQWLTSASTTRHAKILMPLQNMSNKKGVQVLAAYNGSLLAYDQKWLHPKDTGHGSTLWNTENECAASNM